MAYAKPLVKGEDRSLRGRFQTEFRPGGPHFGDTRNSRKHLEHLKSMSFETQTIMQGNNTITIQGE